MSALFEYFYTVLTRIWDIISYPFVMVGNLVTYLNGAWSYVASIMALFPAWLTGSIALMFALGVVLLILKR